MTPKIAKLRLVVVGKIVVSAAYVVRKSPDGMREGLAMNHTRSMSLVPNRPYGLIIRMMIKT